jgi:hypothetical protein
MGSRLGGVKRSGRDEPIGVAVHMCMEVTQGNSLCSYLYLKLAKTPCFSYSLFMFFSSTKSENRVCVYVAGWWGGGVWHRWEGRGSGEKG